jgi:hypothetical protein
MATKVSSIRKRRAVWLVVRDDEPTHGEWFLRERDASLKATWLRQSWKAKVRIVKALLPDPGAADDDA